MEFAQEDIQNNFFYLRTFLAKIDDKNSQNVENSLFWVILTIFYHIKFFLENPARSNTTPNVSLTPC